MSLDKKHIKDEANIFGVKYNENDLEGTQREIYRIKSYQYELLKIEEKMKIDKEKIEEAKKKKNENYIKTLNSLKIKENNYNNIQSINELAKRIGKEETKQKCTENRERN